jgi:hypothetical protein
MPQNEALLEKMVLPYFAHCQARILPALYSIAWNKVALSGYLDFALIMKKLDPPNSYLRKIRAFYENYEHIDQAHPLLADLDALSRNQTHLDKDNGMAVTAFALKWNNIVQAFEQFCFDLISQHQIDNPDQVRELLQSLVFTAVETNVLPGWIELLDAQQMELSKVFQLRNLPHTALSKVHFKHQFSSGFQSDQQWLENLIRNDKELQDLIRVLNKQFLRLITQINEKLPEPERQIHVNPDKQGAGPSPDYRLAITYFYDGNDDGEYHANFFSVLKTLLK